MSGGGSSYGHERGHGAAEGDELAVAAVKGGNRDGKGAVGARREVDATAESNHD